MMHLMWHILCRLLDTRGAGYIDLNDLVLALPELGIDKEDAKWGRDNVQLMLNMLTSQNHDSSGQALVAFHEFSNFILKKPKILQDRSSTRDNILNEQQRQSARIVAARNATIPGFASNPHQSETQASSPSENVKKRLGLHNGGNKRRNVSRLSKVREALDNMDPLFTDRLSPSKAQAALSNSLHVKDTSLLWKDWKEFVNTLDHDETGHISMNELLRLLFSSSSDPSETGRQLTSRNNKIGDNKTDSTATKFHCSASISTVPNSCIPMGLKGKQLANSTRHRAITKPVIDAKAKEVCCWECGEYCFHIFETSWLIPLTAILTLSQKRFQRRPYNATNAL